MNNEDLSEICIIVQKRNDIQRRRVSAINKINYLSKIILSKRRTAEKKKLKKIADPETNTPAVFHRKLSNDVTDKMFTHYHRKREYLDVLSNMKEDAQRQINVAKVELNSYKYTNIPHYPAKYDKIKMHKLNTQLQKAKMEKEIAMHESMQHTEDTSLKLRRFLKTNNLKLIWNGNGSVDAIRDKDGEYYGLKQIKEIAFEANANKDLLDG